MNNKINLRIHTTIATLTTQPTNCNSTPKPHHAMQKGSRPMPSNINLHIHTTLSDGGNTPAEIVAMLKEAGVTTFSITDHDTVEGNIEAAALAKEHGLTHINGIELSCCFADGELGLDESWVIHILGYGFDIDLMRDKLVELESKKHTQLRELFDLLVADGYNIDIESITQDGKITERTHIAKELIRKGYATNGDECFSKILNTERYRSFAKYKPSIKEGIKIINDCGGLAVWAHPFGVTRGGKKELTEEQVLSLLSTMLVNEYGIGGIEVYYQQYTLEQIILLNYHAELRNLYASVGTDYHNAAVGLTNNRETLVFDVVNTDFTYRLDEKMGGIVIERYKGTNGIVVVPSEVGGHPIVSIGYGAFNNELRDVNLTSVTIPGSVTVVRDNSFRGCKEGFSVTYKGVPYVMTRYKNKENQHYYDFPAEFYTVLLNGNKYKYCDECPYFSSRLNYDTWANWYFYDCYRMKKESYGYKTIAASMGTPLCDIEVPDWCPLNEMDGEEI